MRTSYNCIDMRRRLKNYHNIRRAKQILHEQYRNLPLNIRGRTDRVGGRGLSLGRRMQVSIKTRAPRGKELIKSKILHGRASASDFIIRDILGDGRKKKK